MAERVLSVRELNRALLACQLLLERSSLSLTAALEQVGGLQSQYAPSAYIGLWSRLRGFHKEHLIQNPFGKLTRAVRRELEAEAYALAEFHRS